MSVTDDNPKRQKRDSADRVWDGRGEALVHARLTVCDARIADDTRLHAAHFRVMAHVGRQNHARGWLRVSQSELAERWGCHRNTINRAFTELVAWRYLLQKTQEAAGESFCLYKTALDGEASGSGGSGVHIPVCTPGAHSSVHPGAHSSVHMCTTEEYTGVFPQCAPPDGAYRGTRARRLTPTNAESPPLPPAKGGGRERGIRNPEIEQIIRSLRADCQPAAQRVVDRLLAPVVTQRRLDAPSADGTLRSLSQWAKAQTATDAVLDAAAAWLLKTRKATVKASDFQAALQSEQVLAADRITIHRGTPQWDAWVGWFRVHQRTLVVHIEGCTFWQVPSAWPPGYSEAPGDRPADSHPIAAASNGGQP